MGSGGQQVIRKRSASVKTKKPYPELTKEMIHKESKYLSAGGSLLRVVWKSRDNDDYISAPQQQSQKLLSEPDYSLLRVSGNNI